MPRPRLCWEIDFKMRKSRAEIINAWSLIDLIKRCYRCPQLSAHKAIAIMQNNILCLIFQVQDRLCPCRPWMLIHKTNVKICRF